MLNRSRASVKDRYNVRLGTQSGHYLSVSVCNKETSRYLVIAYCLNMLVYRTVNRRLAQVSWLSSIASKIMDAKNTLSKKVSCICRQ